jgi:hypothetical protein
MCCGHCAVAYLTAIDRYRWHNNILRFINQPRKPCIASLLREDLYILARTLVSGLRIIRSEMDLNAIDYASDSSDDDCSLEATCQGFTNGVHSEPVLGFERYVMGLITSILCLAERVLTFLRSAHFSVFFSGCFWYFSGRCSLGELTDPVESDGFQMLRMVWPDPRKGC